MHLKYIFFWGHNFFGASPNGGLANGGFRCLSTICPQLSAIVRFCGPFGPLSKGIIRRKMTTIVGNRGQLWTSTWSPHLLPFRLSRFLDVTVMICSPSRMGKGIRFQLQHGYAHMWHVSLCRWNTHAAVPTYHSDPPSTPMPSLCACMLFVRLLSSVSLLSSASCSFFASLSLSISACADGEIGSVIAADPQGSDFWRHNVYMMSLTEL